MKKCIMLIPLAHNDGSQVQPADLTRIFDLLYSRFGGYTIAGTVRGAYRMRDGTRADDNSLEVWVVVDPIRLADVEKVASRICGLFEQESLFFEVVESDVEFIPPTLFDEGQ